MGCDSRIQVRARDECRSDKSGNLHSLTVILTRIKWVGMRGKVNVRTAGRRVDSREDESLG